MNQDLKSRVPAAILYVLAIAGAGIYGTWTMFSLILIFGIICLYEYVSISARTSSEKIYALGLTLCIITLCSIVAVPYHLNMLLIITTSVFLIIGILYLIIQKGSVLRHVPLIISSLLYITLPFVVTLLFLRHQENSNLIVLGTFIILWLNDAGAYFIGKGIGKRKLFRSISPNKSWEGSIGGGIVGLFICFAIAPIVGGTSLTHWLILSIIIWISGTYGDLFESAWKRSFSIKDSGNFMGGHGGFLDRLDSFIYAIPFVILYYNLFLL